ncbi:6,7-dimethyl-8-ribityllumazine synthase [Legionella geestiana]|uniref:6,7-dimethyl-8-ribityllumazine synthase n=1 Tax=Legionella geestiana TaxID=45065 RepID=A0A0W0TXP5_9GAMM|nr:6,7-dimethyl-8-ribityllumazine synthase [Legionella geestiana]KTD00107.1 6,7-dimethyl-8-ribityllumazine synthase [Legionella geestiana]QBS11846.1 6,7-dimethyl-8-ribityllumazine synthase [Legionella geestiana]STX53458.1 6,7-dimethyl-8-ribityllumazine synthase [Legionella geestiana]
MTLKDPSILVVCSNYYPNLAEKQLARCVSALDELPYAYEVEMVQAGTYEIPAVIRHFHHNRPFDAYLSLGLLLKGSTDHYQFILEHVKACFIQFTLEGIILGDGNVYAPTEELLLTRVADGERVMEAVRAVDYLLGMKKR